jgi:hypothetical protein
VRVLFRAAWHNRGSGLRPERRARRPAPLNKEKQGGHGGPPHQNQQEAGTAGEGDGSGHAAAGRKWREVGKARRGQWSRERSSATLK